MTNIIISVSSSIKICKRSAMVLIQFEIFSDSQFGTETEMFQAVSDGSLDAVCISNNIVSGSIPQLQVLDLPYFFDSEDEYQFLVDNEDFLNEITPIYEGTWNMHQFAPVLSYASWRTLFTKGKAVKTFEDMKDLNPCYYEPRA